jgi:hypothetical protein
MPSVAQVSRPERAHLAHHLRDLLELAALGRAIGRAHAEARGTGRARGARPLDHLRHRHERLGADAGVVAHALRAIGAIFRTGAGLDRQQRAHLHGVGRVPGAVHACAAEDQIGERLREQRLGLR